MAYCYAQGPLASGTLEVEAGWLRFGFEGRAVIFWSIDSGYDGQSRIENNFSLRDTRVFARATASFQSFRGPIRLALELDDDLRDSDIPGTSVRSIERRAAASLILASR